MVPFCRIWRLSRIAAGIDLFGKTNRAGYGLVSNSFPEEVCNPLCCTSEKRIEPLPVFPLIPGSR
jgi:hypothetical protein